MRRNLFIITMFLFLVAQADENKCDSIIQTLITKELGLGLTWRTDESILTDSINETPIDSVCLHKAIRLNDEMQHFILNISSLIELFPRGTTSIERRKLSIDKFDKYEYYAAEMKKWFVKQRELVDVVDNYIPYKYKKVTERYTVFDGNGGTLKYYGVYFFDEQDNLEKYFWFDERKWAMTMGMIVFAINHDFSFLEKTLDSLGFQCNEALLLDLMGDEDAEFNISELNQILALREIHARKESQTASNSSQQDNSSTLNSNSQTLTNQDILSQYTSRRVKMEGPKYIVKRDVCGATYSMKARKKFTEYAINNNIVGLAYMIVSDQLIELRRGQIVTMLDCGVFMSKVQLSDGTIVYTDTEYLQQQLM